MSIHRSNSRSSAPNADRTLTAMAYSRATPARRHLLRIQLDAELVVRPLAQLGRAVLLVRELRQPAQVRLVDLPLRGGLKRVLHRPASLLALGPDLLGVQLHVEVGLGPARQPI